MSQSLYTAMGGVSAAQTSLNVISNNIANINTTAFKSSSTNFSEVYSSTMSSGTAASGTTGGINPMQVGLGVQVSSISKDFTSGTWVATGKTTDLMLEGDGFFTVQSPDGQKFYTRAGDFSFDSDGDLVTSSGFKVLGTSSLLASTTSTVPVHIPQKLVREIIANSATWNEALTDLNNCSLTDGNFNLVVNGSNTLTLNVDTGNYTTMGQIAGSLQTQIDAASTLADNRATAAGTAATDVGDASTDAATAYTTGATMTSALRDDIYDLVDASSTYADSALALGIMSQTQHDTLTASVANARSLTLAAYNAGSGNMTTTMRDDIQAAVTSIQNVLTAVQTSQTAIHDAYDNVTVACNAGTAGTIQFGVDGVHATALSFEAASSNQSNFVQQTGLSTAAIEDDTYKSKVLDYTVSVTQVTNIEDSTAVNSYSIGDDGSVEATYANGDTLSVKLSSDGNNYEFEYTTAENVKITGAKVDMDPNVAKIANFVIQLASITNNEGLLSVGNNLFSAGPNCGDIIYSVGTKMGLGNVSSGGLEASNVDLSAQFSNMILAQRAVQANSRVFSTTSDIMDIVVNMGR